MSDLILSSQLLAATPLPALLAVTDVLIRRASIEQQTLNKLTNRQGKEKEDKLGEELRSFPRHAVFIFNAMDATRQMVLGCTSTHKHYP